MGDNPATIHVHVDVAPDEFPVGYGDLRWLPVLGPTCTIMQQWVCANAQYPGITIDAARFAATFGLSQTTMWRSVGRLVQFRAAAMPARDVLVVRAYLPLPHTRACRLDALTDQAGG